MEDLVGCPVSVAFAGPGVKLVSDPVTLLLGEILHACSFGEILADQPVGVLVGAALPGVVRRRKVERHLAFLLHFLIAVKFTAVVRGDGVVATGMPRHQFQQPPGGFPDGPLGQLADLIETAFAIDERDDRFQAAAMHGVDFPMSDGFTASGLLRAFTDRTLARKPAAAVVGSVALPPPLVGTAQMAPEIPSGAPVPEHMLIDGLMADAEDSAAVQISGDLLGTPVATQQGFDGSPVIRPEPAALAVAGPPATGHAVGMGGTVASIGRIGIAADFAADGRGAASELFADLAQAQVFAPQRGNRESLLLAELVVFHARFTRPESGIAFQKALRLLSEFRTQNKRMQATGVPPVPDP